MKFVKFVGVFGVFHGFVLFLRTTISKTTANVMLAVAIMVPNRVNTTKSSIGLIGENFEYFCLHNVGDLKGNKHIT